MLAILANGVPRQPDIEGRRPQRGGNQVTILKRRTVIPTNLSLGHSSRVRRFFRLRRSAAAALITRAALGLT